MKNKKPHCLQYFFLLLCLLLSSCADMFQPKIPMPGDKKETLDEFFPRSGDEITKLSTPIQFYVAPYYSSSEIQLTWSAVRGAAYYMVERAVAASGEEPDSGDYEPLPFGRSVYPRPDGSLFYVDEILRNPTLDSPEFQNRYFYRVSAFNPAQKFDESEPTVPQSAMLFRAVTNVKASGGTSIEEIVLQWEPSVGAESYEILRSDFSNGASATRIATVMGSQTWYTNKVSAAEQGKDFYYKIKAVNSFNKETPESRLAYGYARVYGAPDAPNNVRLAENSGRGHSITEIKIEWDKVDEEDAYYAVYRYSEADSSLTRLTSKTTDKFLIDNQGLKPGIYYYYRVQAILEDISSGKELKSQFSSADPEGFLLSSPEEVVAEKSSDGTSVTVKWKPAKGSEGERLQYTYNVYTDSNPEGAFSNAVVSSVSSNPGADGYISVGGLTVATGAFFRVSTVKGGVESGKSFVVSPSPAAAIIQYASQYAYIAGENANANRVYPVKITWKKPENEFPAFYHVQRSTKSGSGYAKINDEPLREDGTGTAGFTYDSGTGVYTYIDKNEAARVGRKYYYRVLSLNQLGQGSFPSDERVGWGALTYEQYALEYNKTMGAALKKLTYMHKPGSTEKLGTETKYSSIGGGSIYYNAALDGLGARIIIRVTNYADFYIENVPENGVYFTLNGNSNTSANMSSNGTMDGTVTATGMYPGSLSYDGIQIKGGAAGGGTYGVQPAGFPRAEISWTVLE